MSNSQRFVSLMSQLLIAASLFFVTTGTGYAWWGHRGGWGHGYYHHGWYHGGGWGYGRGFGVARVGYVGFGGYGGAPCRLVGGYRNLYGHWVGVRRICW